MIHQQFAEFLNYLMLTGLIFYLFVFLLVVFGHIFVDIFLKKIIKTTKKTPVIELIFLSFGVGTSIYISISFILLVFNAFNIYTAYFSLIIVDSIYILYRFQIKFENFHSVKLVYYDSIIKIKKKKKSILILFILLFFFIILQFNLQWPLITESEGLMFLDPYSYLRKIYTLLQNGAIYLNGNGNGSLYYPNGYYIFCSGALQICKENYILGYYFLKFGSVHLLFLFTIIIFFISLKKFKRVYISVSCVILLLSFYYTIFRFNAFLTGSIGVFFVGISLIIFINQKRFLYLLGFFIPLFYFFNPTICFYFIIVISVYLLIYLFYFDSKYYKDNIVIIIGIVIVAFILLTPYMIYALKFGVSVIDLINYNIQLFFKPYVSTTIPGPGPSPEPISVIPKNVFDSLIEFIFGEGFTFASKAFQSLLIFGFFSFLGLIYISSKEVGSRKSIHFICKVAFVSIIAAYILVMATSHAIFFFVIFQDRIIECLCPFVVILCGFGIEKTDFVIQKAGNHLKQFRYFKDKIKFRNELLKKILTPKNIFVMILLPSLIGFRFSQNELVSDLTYYQHDDSLVDSYLYLRENSLPHSNILSPDNSLMRKILYDMLFFVSPFNINTSFSELETFVVNNNLNYLLLNKSVYHQNIFGNLTNSINYIRVHKNSIFDLYKVL